MDTRRLFEATQQVGKGWGQGGVGGGGCSGARQGCSDEGRPFTSRRTFLFPPRCVYYIGMKPIEWTNPGMTRRAWKKGGKHKVASGKERESKMQTELASGPRSTAKSSHSWWSQTFLLHQEFETNASTAPQRVARGLVRVSALKLGWKPDRLISCSLSRWCTSLWNSQQN